MPALAFDFNERGERRVLLLEAHLLLHAHAAGLPGAQREVNTERRGARIGADGGLGRRLEAPE